MHLSLAGIFSDHPVDHNLLFSCGEPALLATEPVRRSAWACWHQSGSRAADDESEDTLDEEHPPPACSSFDATHLEQANSEKAGKNICEAECHPEEAEPDSELVVLIEVGEIEDDLCRGCK